MSDVRTAKPSNLEAFLEYYYDLKGPGPSYAVLVDKPWGSGKTWQVKHAVLAATNP